MHPDNAYIDVCFHTVRADQVIGPDRDGQAIVVGINQRQQFLFAVERSDVAARAKDFFAHDRGGFGQVSPMKLIQNYSLRLLRQVLENQRLL